MAFDFSKAAAGAGTGAKIGSMIPIPGAGLVGAGLGALFGFGKKSKSPQEIAAEKYYNELEAIGVPPKEALTALYQRFQSAGELTPEMEQNFQQADSEMKAIEADPALREAQTKALDTLKREAEQQGMTLEDKIAVTEGQMASEAEAQGRQGAILQNLAARGQLGAGQELAARMQAEQAGASREALRSAEVANAARKRALDAVLRGGALAGDVRTQDFSEKSDVAKAQDEINRFNIANRQGTETRNVIARNEASRFNLSKDQDISNLNTGLSNKESDNSVGALMQNRAMQTSLAKDKFDAKTGGMAATKAANAESSTGMANTLKGIGETFGSMYDESGERKKNPFYTPPKKDEPKKDEKAGG